MHEQLRNQIDVMTAGIRARVEAGLEQELDELKKEMTDRVVNLVDAYKKDVMGGIKVSVDSDTMSGGTTVNFQIKIDDTKAREALQRRY